MNQLLDFLPEIYQSILPKNFLEIELNETAAQCHNCNRARDQRFDYLYNKNLKCCTFFPLTPNYAVGGIFHKNLSTVPTLLDMITHQKYTLPLGIFPHLKYQYQFQNKKETDFGTQKSFLCPYYNTSENRCGHWEFRGTVCTTYYCRSSYGKKGLYFWEHVNQYLSYVEMALAEECLVLLDFSPRDISDQLQFLNKKDFSFEERNKTTLDQKEYKKFWNGYKDPRSFYLQCYGLVQNFSPKEMKVILGDQGQSLLNKTIEFKRKNLYKES